MTEPALEGDLTGFLPSEILQFLQLCAVTGRVEFERPGETVTLTLVDGRPVEAESSRGSVRLGEILVHRGALAPAELERAVALQHERSAERLGSLIVRLGLARPASVARAIEEGLKRVLLGVLLWPGGRFRFVPGDGPALDELAPEIALDELILEGLEQADLARDAG